MVMSVWALIIQLGTFWQEQNWLLLVMDVIILIAALWVTVEALASLQRARRSPAITWTDEDVDAPEPVR